METYRPGVPKLQAVDGYRSGPVRNQATQQDVRLIGMHLNCPRTIPPTPGHGKIVFHETGPRCQKGWVLLPQSTLIFLKVEKVDCNLNDHTVL